MKRIVIVGAGFGGIYAYLTLHRLFHNSKNIEIVVINPHDFFSFTPLIHEVATGNLLPSSVTQSIRTIPHCCLDQFILGTVSIIDCDTKNIHYIHTYPSHAKELSQKISYDYLIIAAGSETDFHTIPGAQEFALQLKNIEDAKKIKNKILDCFEHAQTLTNPQDIIKTLTFVVIGGGPTGIELAAELADYIKHELTRIFPTLSKKASIVLVHAHEHFLPQTNPWFHKKIMAFFKNIPFVTLKMGYHVTRVHSDGIYLEKEYIPASTIVWVAGVKARDMHFTALKKIEKDKKTKRIKINHHLQLIHYPNCFVVGDQAWVCDTDNMEPYPMRAQFAVREGVLAARNIVSHINNKPLEVFHYHDQGFIISLGNKNAVALIGGMKLSGFLAWWIYRTAYLLKMLGLRAKLRTALEWTLNLFLSRDVNRL